MVARYYNRDSLDCKMSHLLIIETFKLVLVRCAIKHCIDLLLCSQHLALYEHQTYVDSRKPSATAAIFVQTGSDLLI